MTRYADIKDSLQGRPTEVDIDFETEPLGHDAENKPIFLRDIWPTRQEIQVCFLERFF